MEVCLENRFFTHVREFQISSLTSGVVIATVEHLALYYSFEQTQSYLVAFFNVLSRLHQANSALEVYAKYFEQAVAYACQTKNIKFLEDVLENDQMQVYFEGLNGLLPPTKGGLPAQLRSLSQMLGVGFKIQLESGTVLTIHRNNSVRLYLQCTSNGIRCYYCRMKHSLTPLEPFPRKVPSLNKHSELSLGQFSATKWTRTASVRLDRQVPNTKKQMTKTPIKHRPIGPIDKAMHFVQTTLLGKKASDTHK